MLCDCGHNLHWEYLYKTLIILCFLLSSRYHDEESGFPLRLKVKKNYASQKTNEHGPEGHYVSEIKWDRKTNTIQSHLYVEY